MADQITQTLGFDVSQALSALQRLDAALNNSSASLQKMADAAAKFNSTASNVDSVANKAGQAFKSGIAAGAQVAAQQTDQLTVSLGLLSRVVFVQAVVRGLSILRNEFKSTLQGGLDFARGLSEIQTLAPNQTLNSLGDDVRKLSDEFNVPLLQVTKAEYDALSNGFTKAADRAELLAAAFRLSKTGISTADESLNLLSTSLNAFGKSADQAENFGAKFFEAINVGRFTASELAANLGKVAPSAVAVGASMEEILAEFTTLTIRGFSAAEAATAINAGLSALLKPSKPAADVLHALGFESGQAAVKALGLVGAYKAMVQAVNNQPDAVARLFPNIRAVKEIFALTGEGFDTFTDHLKQISDFTPSDHFNVWAKRVSTDAERVESDLNKLSNALTVGVGGSLVKSAADFSKFVGGVDNAVSVVNVAGPALIGLGVTLTGLASKFTAATLGVNTFAGALGGINPLLLVPFAQGLGKSIGEFIDDRQSDKALASVKKLTAENNAAVKAMRDSGATAAEVQAQEIANARDEIDKLTAQSQNRLSQLKFPEKSKGFGTTGEAADLKRQFQSLNDELAETSKRTNIADDDITGLLDKLRVLNEQSQAKALTRGNLSPEVESIATGIEKLKELQQLQQQTATATTHGAPAALSAADVAAAKLANSDLVKNDKDTLDRIIQARQKFAGDLKKLAQQAENDVISAKKRGNDLAAQLDDQRFNFSTKRFNDLQQVARNTSRADDLSADAAKKLAAATSPDQKEAADREFQRAAAFAQQAAAAAQASGNRTAQLNAEKEIEAVLEREIGATRQYEAARRQVAQQANAAAAAEQARVDDIAKTTKSFLTNISQFDAKGNKLPEAQIKLNTTQAARDLEHLKQILFTPSSNFDFSAVLGFDKLQDRLNQAVTGARISQLFATPESLTGMDSQIQQHLDTQTFRANVQANVVGGGGGGGGGDTEEEHFGGPIRRFAGGGFVARGTDTVPAMLTPGEFVMNAASTQKFFSQLVAMNAGHAPVFRSGGGPVNVSLGGITIHETKTPQATARETVAAIRRELRRGTVQI